MTQMTRRNQLKLFTLIVLTMLTTACIHKVGAVTPWERVHTYNAALAESNQALEQGMEVTVAAGVLPAQNAQPIIACTGQIAAIHEQVTAILGQGSATAANVTAVQALVDQIKTSIAGIPPATLGIKNPKSQQTFKADLDGLSTLADAVIVSLKAVLP